MMQLTGRCRRIERSAMEEGVMQLTRRGRPMRRRWRRIRADEGGRYEKELGLELGTVILRLFNDGHHSYTLKILIRQQLKSAHLCTVRVIY